MKALKSDTTTKGDRAAAARSLWRAYSTEGGFAVLYGNPAEKGCIVKMRGVRDLSKVEGA